MSSPIIDKIKKLLALSKSTNPHEAALAMQRAVEMMQKYGVSQADIDISEITEMEGDGSSSMPGYAMLLMGVVCCAFGCRSVLRTSSIASTAVFYGPASRVEIAVYVYAVCKRMLLDARAEYKASITPRQKRDPLVFGELLRSFSSGWVMAVSKTISAFSLSEREERIMLQWEQRHGIDRRPMPPAKAAPAPAAFRRSSQISNRAYADGAAAGRNVSIMRPMEASLRPRSIQ